MKMIIDLTHKISGEMPYYPGTPKPSAEKFCTIEKEGYTELELIITTHTGTHIDAPAHIIPSGETLDQKKIEDFTGIAAVLDCTGSDKLTGGNISFKSLKEFLDKHPGIDFLVLKTGWQYKWGNPDYFKEFPVLTEEGAELIIERNIRCVCMDAISADKVEDAHLPVHKKLLGNGVMIAENLTNLDLLPDGKFELYLIPLLISEADGSPLRAFAKI
jgi:kynurenine formamidase